MSAKNKPARRRVEFRVMTQNQAHQRACDGCTACCVVLPITETESPEFQPCQFLAGSGCGTYPTRPPVCRKFQCEWAQGNAPAWMKPDVCGVMPVHTVGNTAMHLWELWPGASLSESVQQFIWQSNAQQIHVLVTLHPEKVAAGETTPRKNRVYLANGEMQEFEGLTFSGTPTG